MTKEEIKKADYPMNRLGLGFRTTLESGPYFKDDVDYEEPMENDNYVYCGACAFYKGGQCKALEEDVHILASCKLYISMEHELSLRHQSLKLKWHHAKHKMEGKKRKEEEEGHEEGEEPKYETSGYYNWSAEDVEESFISLEELDIFEVTNKKIVREKGKFCVRSHQTGKNFGCYDTRPEAAKRLGQIKGFKKDEDIPEVIELEPVNKEDIVSMELICKFAGADEEQRLVYGIVMEPDEIDTQEETVKSHTIEAAAHGYMMKPMIIGDGHLTKAKAQPVESFIYNPEVLTEVKPGSWVMTVKVHSEKLWEGVKKGDYTGFSIGAMGKRTPIKDPIEEEVED